VLLLDEADSFLSARDRAHARWEVTQTNELLTQIEGFEGLLVCTTNRLDDLDPAALRRFDFKVAFRPLGPDQRLALVRQCCRQLGIPAPTDHGELLERVRTLDGCTPGDAAAVLRRMAVSHERRSLDALLCALADECRLKPTAHAPIGFVR
jgi:SpoVK/Ycf46/Vps4 family AAA+-type ATPase